MVKVFSFCIYGSIKKYTEGLLKNIELITEYFPEFKIWIYAGQDVPEDYIKKYKSYNQVIYIPSEHSLEKSSHTLMTHRFFPIDDTEVEICFVRDADSRIYNRDRWCISEFLKSDKKFHIIRDHFWHKEKITGATWGIKKGLLNQSVKNLATTWLQNQTNTQYGADQKFLSNLIYPLIKDDLLIHSNIIGFSGEKITEIPEELESNTDFVGNVYEYNENGEEYPKFRYNDYPFMNQFQFLLKEGQHLLLTKICKNLNFYDFPDLQKNFVLDHLYIANYYTQQWDECIRVFKLFEYCNVSEHNIQNSNYFLQVLYNQGKHIIGTCDLSLEPKNDEIIIYYGNFPLDYHNLPYSNKIYRHPRFANSIKHSKFEGDKCWNKIDQIYILNLEERVDRFYETLVELTRVNAPLDKVYHYKGKKESILGEKMVDSYLGATKNHLDAVNHFIENKYKYALILEDDFTFSSRISGIKKDLLTFFDREYDFDVCLVAASKNGKIIPKDDLLNLSHQVCTTTAGYIINHKTIERVRECFQTGYDKIKETRDYHTYVCDRYWAKLQKDNKFFIFRNKFGYQRPNYSSIFNKTVCYFD